jgi:Zn-finger protein
VKCSACGHRRDFHFHHRRGSDCSLCRCPRYSVPMYLLVLDWVRRTIGRR